MNDDLLNAAREQMNEALKKTQTQSQEAAAQLGGLLRFGAKKLTQAAAAASQAIREDIDKRP
ncbi:MAG: hypothetical protein ABR508_05980 [Candidatus Baltobacteraceae bacterium]